MTSKIFKSPQSNYSKAGIDNESKELQFCYNFMMYYGSIRLGQATIFLHPSKGITVLKGNVSERYTYSHLLFHVLFMPGTGHNLLSIWLELSLSVKGFVCQKTENLSINLS